MTEAAVGEVGLESTAEGEARASREVEPGEVGSSCPDPAPVVKIGKRDGAPEVSDDPFFKAGAETARGDPEMGEEEEEAEESFGVAEEGLEGFDIFWGRHTHTPD